MYLLMSFRKSTAPHNRQLILHISSNKGYVDRFVSELTSANRRSEHFGEIPGGAGADLSGLASHAAQGFLAHKKQHPPRTLQ